MKTVRQLCALQPNASTLSLIEQVEHIDDLSKGVASGKPFFERTHITDGMRTLATEGINRLAGVSKQAAFELKQSMGGGKTHLMIGLGLLAQDPALRKEYFPEVSGSNMFGSAKVATFNGRSNPPEYFWGEIAKQLGNSALFRKFWEEGPLAPEPKDWLELFSSTGQPVLVLLDEMPPYFQYISSLGPYADRLTRAFANMLEAAGQSTNVCVVVSDLTTSYASGGAMINRALQDASSELGRQVKTITPVDLATGEIYSILRKRLFAELPGQSEIDLVASAFEDRIRDAVYAKTLPQTSTGVVPEIQDTYPFHPSLKNIIALFKENEDFKQTRGLIELVSKLVKSVWSQNEDDVYLIGAQHFDLSISDVREKLVEISGMGDIVARDIWDSGNNAHAQVIDDSTHGSAGHAQRAATLLLLSSLSSSVNAVKGLLDFEIVETLLAPNAQATDFKKPIESLERQAWYLHRTQAGRLYFDRQENLTKRLQTTAKNAPKNKIDEVIAAKLTEMFEPKRKVAYQEVMPLPLWDEVAERIKRGRVLLIVSPDSKIPPETVQRFFEEVSRKNNFCVLTGTHTSMASLEDKARTLYAAMKTNADIPVGSPQKEEIEKKLEEYKFEFVTTVQALFDKLYFPLQKPGRAPELVARPLGKHTDASTSFDGERLVEETLKEEPRKLYVDIDADWETLKAKMEIALWQDGEPIARWDDIKDGYYQNPSMPWLPPRGIEDVKTRAIAREQWEELPGDMVTHAPVKKKTEVRAYVENGPDDNGRTVLVVGAGNAGNHPRIHYAENAKVSTESPVLEDDTLTTTALRVEFLAVDPSGEHETGEPFLWETVLKVRVVDSGEGPNRQATLIVAPEGTIRYTLDGRNAREGEVYTQPIPVGNEGATIQVFAEADGLEFFDVFKLSKIGTGPIPIDPVLPALIRSENGVKFNTKQSAFAALRFLRENACEVSGVRLVLGATDKDNVRFSIAGKANPKLVEEIMERVLLDFPEGSSIMLALEYMQFQTGAMFLQFQEETDIVVKRNEISQ